jgi:carbamate kinase
MCDATRAGHVVTSEVADPLIAPSSAPVVRPAAATRTALVAVGGNSLIRVGEAGTIQQQVANVRCTARAVVNLVRSGFRLIMTHGNGPQVGAALLRSERASDQVPGHPLDVCGASTQGEIGYLLQQALRAELAAAGMKMPVASIVCQTVVNADDPAFQHPTKPIGPFYAKDEAESRQRSLGWSIVEDASRGYRRVVASPEPIRIVEDDVIRLLLGLGVLVVAAGGGGIPVVCRNGGFEGVEAVIDKDRASALLATSLGVDLLIISTDADRVYLDYKKPTERPLTRVTAAEMQRYYDERHFPPGNMGPKIESALRFLQAGGQEVIITTFELLVDAVHGTAGTHIVA